MYRITHFDKKLCRLLKHHLDLVDENVCDIYSIWNFCPRTRWKAMKSIFGGKYLCRAPYFPYLYWLVLTVSVMGSFYSLSEFTSLFWGGRKQVSMWRQRTFYVLPPAVLRKCRLVGAFIMSNAWLLLWYAVVKVQFYLSFKKDIVLLLFLFLISFWLKQVSPSHMTPWLTINMFVLVSELIIWITEVFSGVCKLELQTLLSFSLATVNYLFVRCVQSVFQRAIEMNDVEDLRLWKSP